MTIAEKGCSEIVQMARVTSFIAYRILYATGGCTNALSHCSSANPCDPGRKLGF